MNICSSIFHIRVNFIKLIIQLLRLELMLLCYVSSVLYMSTIYDKKKQDIHKYSININKNCSLLLQMLFEIFFLLSISQNYACQLYGCQHSFYYVCQHSFYYLQILDQDGQVFFKYFYFLFFKWNIHKN